MTNECDLNRALKNIRRALCTTYEKYLVLFCSQQIDAIFCSSSSSTCTSTTTAAAAEESDVIPRWVAAVSSIVALERTIIQRAAFFTAAEADGMIFAALTALVAVPMPRMILGGSSGGVRGVILRGEFDLLGAVFATMTMWTQYRQQQHHHPAANTRTPTTHSTATRSTPADHSQQKRLLHADFNAAVTDGFRLRLQKVSDDFGHLRRRLNEGNNNNNHNKGNNSEQQTMHFDVTMAVANELDLLHRVCREQLQSSVSAHNHDEEGGAPSLFFVGVGSIVTTTEETLKAKVLMGTTATSTTSSSSTGATATAADGPLKNLPVLMADALDFAMRSPNITDEERQFSIFPKISRLQNLLVEPDKFYENHRARTAARLLTNLQQRIDDDRQLLTCLQKFCCGLDHSSLNGVVSMMADIERSATATNELEKALAARNANTDRTIPIEFIPLALTTWTTFVGSARKTSYDFVNNFLKRTHTDMLEWCLCRNPGRRVSLYSEVTLTIRTNAKMSYEFIVPPNMADALMIIASASPTKKELLSYIAYANSGSNNNERLLKEMDKIVEVLSKKIKIVCCGEGTADSGGGKLSINGNFKSPQRKINLLPREVVDEKVIASNLNLSRAFAVQHALVRVMKKNKDMSVPHNDLMSDAMTLLVNTFKPAAADIKAQISELICRNVIKRDDQKPGHYLYIA